MGDYCSHCGKERKLFDVFVISDGMCSQFCDLICCQDYFVEMKECTEEEDEDEQGKQKE